MKLCFPVEEARSLDSRVCEHFGSAPAFIVFNTETKEEKTVLNNDAHHSHGMCSPLKALAGQQVDAIILSGIGRGALMRLTEAGIKVYKAFEGTVSENLKLFELGRLPQFRPGNVCTGHEGCAH